MNTYLFRPAVMAKYYNCSSRTLEEWESLAEPNVRLAIVYGVLGIVYWTSYMPFLFVFIKSDLLRHSCYKIMFFLGCIDIACIPICCFFVAYCTARGLLYCLSPRLIYVAGCGALGLWCAGSTTCMLLGFNRCVDLVSPKTAEMLFKGRRTLLWLLIPTAYFVYFFFFHTTVCFSSKLYTVFFDPFIGLPERNGSVDSINYPHLEHSMHNFVVVVVMAVCYNTLCINFYFKMRSVNIVRITQMQRQTILQSALICSATFVASLLYIYMQFLPVPPWVIILGHICWQSSHGIVGITYLLFNSTLRNGIIRLFCGQPRNVNPVSTTITGLDSLHFGSSVTAI